MSKSPSWRDFQESTGLHEEKHKNILNDSPVYTEDINWWWKNPFVGVSLALGLVALVFVVGKFVKSSSVSSSSGPQILGISQF
jgi:hypothetical protein